MTTAALKTEDIRKRDEAAPRRTIASSMELGAFVHMLRSGLGIKQAELARRAGVGRQWIGALEQGKPTLEIQMVLRTLDTLGLEIEVKPWSPTPAWIKAARTEAERERNRKAWEQRQKRKTRREAARMRRLAQNVPTVRIELE